MWQDLVDVLGEIVSHYEKLIALGKKKRAVLVVVDMKGLDAVTKDEQAILAAIQKAEEKRKRILLKMSMTDPKMRPDMRLVETYLHCSSAKTRTALQKLHAKLNQVTQEAQESEENNAILLNAALEAVRFQLNRIHGSEVSPTYGGHGQERVTSRKKFEFQA